MERSDVPPGDNQLKNATLIAFGGWRVAPQAPTKFDESRSESRRLASRKSHMFGTEILSGGKLPRANRCVKYYRLPLENESYSANKKCCR